MASKRHKPMSSFITDLKDLTDEELWAILLYCSTTKSEEKWEIRLESQYKWLSGSTRGHDSGEFYQFLVLKGLDKKIEIIRE